MTNKETAVVWISDGSGVPFSDLEVVDAAHPGLMGQAVSYKGTIDVQVQIGNASYDLDRNDDVFVPEAEWCIGFPGGPAQYLKEPQRFTEDTPIVLQGMIEGKWLNRLIGTGGWKPASMGNNLLAAGPGIATTLAAIEQGLASGSIEIRHETGAKPPRTQSSLLSDLAGQSIPALVRAVLHVCRDTDRAVDWINCSAQGRNAAIVNEPERMQKALQDSGMAPSEIATPGGVGRLAEVFVPQVISEGITVPPEVPVQLRVRGPNGETVGQGELVLRRR